LPRNRYGSVLAYIIIIVVTLRLIIYLFTSYLPPAFSAVFGAGRSRQEGETPPRNSRRSVTSYFILVVLFVCLFIYIAPSYFNIVVILFGRGTVAAKPLRQHSLLFHYYCCCNVSFDYLFV